jgi:hypothetical protein
MIRFEFYFINLDLIDATLIEDVKLAINQQLIKKKFLLDLYVSISTVISSQGLTYEFNGVNASGESIVYLMNLFRYLLAKAAVDHIIKLERCQTQALVGDKIFRSTNYANRLTSHQVMLQRMGSSLEIPKSFVCQLTGQVMDSPVSFRQNPGVYYDKTQIQYHLFAKKLDDRIDPSTKKQVDPVNDLVKDPILKMQISGFVRQKVEQNAKDRFNSLNLLLHKYDLVGVSFENLGKALRMCTQANDIEGANLLVSCNKLNIDSSDSMPNSKKTALHIAIQSNHHVIANLLVKSGADVNIKDALGKTPVVYALESGQPDLIKAVMPDVDVTKILQSVASMTI